MSFHAAVRRARVEVHRGHTLLGYEPCSRPLIIDCGAHKGEFSTDLARIWGASGHAIEASPLLFAQLVLPEGVIGHNFAVGGQDGTVPFAVLDNPEASHIATSHAGVESDNTVEVPMRSLSAFLDEVAPDGLDVLKLDIEGAEIAALASLSDAQLLSIGQITIEFHDFCGYISRDEAEAAIARLERLGFAVFPFSVTTLGDVLFVNRKLIPLNALERWHLGVWQKYADAVKRRLQRSTANWFSRRAAA